MSPNWKKYLGFTGFFAVGVITMSLLAGTLLLAPVRQTFDAKPKDLTLVDLEIPYASERFVRGWFSKPAGAKAGVILSHGIRSNRLQLVSVARFLLAAGYAVALIDLPSHGESSGDRISLGFNESKGISATARFLKEQMGMEKVGAIGPSLGGAAIILGDSEKGLDAIVLEAVFSSVGKAIDNRMAIRFGSAGTLLSPLLTLQLAPRLGLSEEDLSPVLKIGDIDTPVFIISGEEDLRTTREDTLELYRAANEPKELWLVPEAKHVDLYKFAGGEYETKILSFFGRHLNTSVGRGATGMFDLAANRREMFVAGKERKSDDALIKENFARRY